MKSRAGGGVDKPLSRSNLSPRFPREPISTRSGARCAPPRDTTSDPDAAQRTSTGQATTKCSMAGRQPASSHPARSAWGKTTSPAGTRYNDSLTSESNAPTAEAGMTSARSRSTRYPVGAAPLPERLQIATGRYESRSHPVAASTTSQRAVPRDRAGGLERLRPAIFRRNQDPNSREPA